jgi:hypothetical protein
MMLMRSTIMTTTTSWRMNTTLIQTSPQRAVLLLLVVVVVIVMVSALALETRVRDKEEEEEEILMVKAVKAVGGRDAGEKFGRGLAGGWQVLWIVMRVVQAVKPMVEGSEEKMKKAIVR